MRKLILSLVSIAFLAPAMVNAGGGDNHAAAFLGQTKSDAHTENTFGIEYERRLPWMDRMFGVGLVYESIQSDPSATVFVVGAVVHPWKDLKANLSVGQESIASHSETVYRAGLGYDFHYKSVSYGPVYNLDRIAGHNYHVYGIALGMGF